MLNIVLLGIQGGFTWKQYAYGQGECDVERLLSRREWQPVGIAERVCGLDCLFLLSLLSFFFLSCFFQQDQFAGSPLLPSFRNTELSSARAVDQLCDLVAPLLFSSALLSRAMIASASPSALVSCFDSYNRQTQRPFQILHRLSRIEVEQPASATPALVCLRARRAKTSTKNPAMISIAQHAKHFNIIATKRIGVALCSMYVCNHRCSVQPRHLDAPARRAKKKKENRGELLHTECTRTTMHRHAHAHVPIELDRAATAKTAEWGWRCCHQR